MTVVCCWLDNSYGRNRITLLADSRITSEDQAGKVTVINETTEKLFRLRINCFHLENLDNQTGAYSSPYFETEIGIGFSGYCVEALSIIATITRCLEGLIADSTDKPLPTPKGIVALFYEVISRYFSKHSQSKTQVVDFFVCGYSPTRGNPWLAKIVKRPKKDVSIEWLNLDQNDFHAIGNIIQVDPKYQTEINELRDRIAKHKATLQSNRDDIEAQFEHERESARHDIAQKKTIERKTLSRLYDPFVHGVGGVLQKMEIYQQGQSARVVFTKDNRAYLLDGLPTVDGHCLGVIPIAENMG